MKTRQDRIEEIILLNDLVWSAGELNRRCDSKRAMKELATEIDKRLGLDHDKLDSLILEGMRNHKQFQDYVISDLIAHAIQAMADEVIVLKEAK